MRTFTSDVLLGIRCDGKPVDIDSLPNQVVVVTTSKPPPRPLLIQGISRQRIPSDTGVGDTVERILAKMGGDQFKWVMKRLGVDCGCGSRQEWLNRVYPYE